jgi:acetyl-CoA acetyltransferase
MTFQSHVKVPVCLIRALEAAGLCDKGRGGQYLEDQYKRMTKAVQDDEKDGTNKHVTTLLADPSFFPVNTHGGLLAYGAPWEVPAMYNIVEATQQLQGQAMGRQIPDCRKALVYGNGGVLSASAVAVLSQSL